MVGPKKDVLDGLGEIPEIGILQGAVNVFDRLQAHYKQGRHTPSRCVFDFLTHKEVCVFVPGSIHLGPRGIHAHNAIAGVVVQ
jgi:hypothetical protein